MSSSHTFCMYLLHHYSHSKFAHTTHRYMEAKDTCLPVLTWFGWQCLLVLGWVTRPSRQSNMWLVQSPPSSLQTTSALLLLLIAHNQHIRGAVNAQWNQTTTRLIDLITRSRHSQGQRSVLPRTEAHAAHPPRENQTHTRTLWRKIDKIQTELHSELKSLVLIGCWWVKTWAMSSLGLAVRVVRLDSHTETFAQTRGKRRMTAVTRN